MSEESFYRASVRIPPCTGWRREEDAGLSEANGDFEALTIPGNDHSFSIWFSWDGIVPVGDSPTQTAGTHAIEFLDAHLK